MNNVRQNLGNQSDDGVADWMANITAGTNNELIARAEFLRRQTVLQREVAQAAKEAAQAAKETAVYTKRNAYYMLSSVIVLGIASAISAGLAFHADNRAANEIKRQQMATESYKVPSCKDGSQICKPWERDWSNAQLQPGSTVTDRGVVIPGPTIKP